MITVADKPIERRREGKRLIVFVCNNIYKLLSNSLGIIGAGRPTARSYPESCLKIDREGQFSAYVNNRMNILLMWIQCIKHRDLSATKQHLRFFLQDMEHHFVDPYAGKKTRNAFRWIHAYVRIYPNISKKDRTQKAYEMIGRIYDSLGILCPMVDARRSVNRRSINGLPW